MRHRLESLMRVSFGIPYRLWGRFTEKSMALIRSGREVGPRPLAQLLVRAMETRCNDLISQLVGDAYHEEISDVLDVRVVTNPESPENV